MRAYLVALCVGMLMLRFVPTLPETVLLLVALGLAFLCVCFRISRWIGFFLIGLCWSCWCATQVVNDRLPLEWDGQTLWLEGEVVGLPQWSVSSAGQSVVRFELEGSVSRRTRLPQRIRVSWYEPPTPVQSGERWKLAVSLKQPYGALNPHGFDYVQWLTARGIGATGSVKAGELLALGRGFSAWRESLRTRMQGLLPETSASAGVIALVLGDGSGISQEQWQVLRDSGTVHLFVISGQHISLVAGLAYALIALLHRLSLWPKQVPWLPVACVFAMLSVLAYGVIAGLDVPVRRAIIMVAVVLLWRLRYLQLAHWTPWLIALCLVLLHDPLVVLAPGFWLSFAAVAVLFVVFAWRLGRFSWWQFLLRAQWAAALGLLPFLIAMNLPVSVVGPLANMLAVPFVSMVTLPLALLGTLFVSVPELARLLLGLSALSLEWLWSVLDWFVHHMVAWQAPDVPGWVLLLTFVGAFLLLLPKALRSVVLVAGLFVPLLWPPNEKPLAPGEAHVWMLDVGQGLALFVRTASNALMYDTGPAQGNWNAGEHIIVPFLRGERVYQLDKLIISHADLDHAGGVGAVIQHIKVRDVLSGEPQRLDKFAARTCEVESWIWDEVLFRQWRWDNAKEGNDASCVLWIQTAHDSFLVTGDLGVMGEAALLAHWPDLKADWLVAGHHGSRTSTSDALIQRVQPRSVLLSRGRYNAYGHPHPLVMQRLQNAGIRTFDTAEDKAILIHLGSSKKVEPWRMAQEQNFWRAQPRYEVVLK